MKNKKNMSEGQAIAKFLLHEYDMYSQDTNPFDVEEEMDSYRPNEEDYFNGDIEDSRDFDNDVDNMVNDDMGNFSDMGSEEDFMFDDTLTDMPDDYMDDDFDQDISYDPSMNDDFIENKKKSIKRVKESIPDYMIKKERDSYDVYTKKASGGGKDFVKSFKTSKAANSWINKQYAKDYV